MLYIWQLRRYTKSALCSLLKYFNDKLLICKTDSTYVFESVEGLSIYFHKIDFKRTGSYIPTAKWLEDNKKLQ